MSDRTLQILFWTVAAALMIASGMCESAPLVQQEMKLMEGP